MKHWEIIVELCARGERNIKFLSNGLVTSNHGRNTINYWMVISGSLICVDCRTV